jgi:hypothetical protein
MDDFDLELEQGLRLMFAPLADAPIPNRRIPSPGGNPMHKLLVGSALALGGVLAAGTAVFAAGTIATGSPNPAVWGQQVSQKVAACKADLKAGQHGIGQCVSDFAKTHGDTTSDAHQNAHASQAGDNASAKGQAERAKHHPQDSPEPSVSPSPAS